MGHWDRFLKYMRGGPDAIDGWPDPIPIEEFNQAVARTSYSPMWGFSLDFVPHVTTSGETKWHRTAKSARFDFVYRPTDYSALASEARDWDVSPVATPEELQEDLARVTRMVMAQAIPFWERVRGIEDLPSVYREHRSRPSVGLPFGSFPQQVLASAFVLARSGDDAGRAELAEYIRAYDVGPDTAKRLEDLLEQEGRR